MMRFFSCNSKRWVAAYTVMEVMMALSVLAVGATGVVAMQKTTMVGNVHARNLNTANAYAASWVGRLRTDALRWVSTASNSNDGTLAQTQWLKDVLNAPGVWRRPSMVGVPNHISYQADVRGEDTRVDANAGFCVNMRLTRMLNNMVRAEVRVFWLRQQGGGVLVAGQPLCHGQGSFLQQVGNYRSRYHFVYLTTAFLRNDSTI